MRCMRVAPLILFIMVVGTGVSCPSPPPEVEPGEEEFGPDNQAAAGQEVQGIRFLDSGKGTRVPVTRADDGGMTALGTTDEDGDIEIDIDALGFGKGEEVAVWVKRCEEGEVVEVILTAANADSPCPPDEGAEAGEGCGCEKIGTFIVGGGTPTFDIGYAPPTFWIALGGGLSTWTNLEDQVCAQDGIDGCNVETTSPTIQVGAGIRPWAACDLGFGADFTYSPIGDITQTFDGGSPATNQIDMSVMTFGGHVDYVYPLRSNLGLYLALGLLWAINNADVSTDYGDDDGPLIENRSESGLRGFGKIGLAVPIGEDYGLRFEVGHTRGKGDDADTNFHFGVKIVRFFPVEM